MTLHRPPPAGAAGRPASWMSRGACQGEDPELFFPISVTGAALSQVSAAREVCGRCTVQVACLAYGVENRQDGIWGGTTPDERRALLRSSTFRAAVRVKPRPDPLESGSRTPDHQHSNVVPEATQSARHALQ